jgi:hypothetical protein
MHSMLLALLFGSANLFAIITSGHETQMLRGSEGEQLQQQHNQYHYYHSRTLQQDNEVDNTSSPSSDSTNNNNNDNQGQQPEQCVTSDNPSQSERQVALDTERGGNPDIPFPSAPSIVRLGVFFHIVHRTDGIGKLTQQQADKQITELNRAFSGQENTDQPDVRVRFFLQGMAYYEDDTLFYNCGPEEVLKEPNAVTPDIVLNVYTCSISWIMGEAIMPGAVDPKTFRPLPNNSWRYGIRLHYAAFSGGGLPNLDSGDILVHEVGHYFGLFHPYFDGCAPGAWSDQIDDTPRMKDNVKGSCAQNRGLRSCAKWLPDNPPDDISNYMVGTDDSCRNHFTKGQVVFMQNSIALNKPQLVAKFTAKSDGGNSHPVQQPTNPVQQPPPPPTTTTTTDNTGDCTWRIKPNIIGSPIQTDMDCELPFKIGTKTYNQPPTIKQSRPFQYTSIPDISSTSYWCSPKGTTKYLAKGATKYLWGLAECI